MVIFLVLVRMDRVCGKLEGLCGCRLYWLGLFVIVMWEFLFRWVSIICICVCDVFWVLLIIMKVWLSVWLCMKVIGVILIWLFLCIFFSWLCFSVLVSVF